MNAGATVKGGSTRSAQSQRIGLSRLLAHTSTTDRCKSFISTHFAKQGGRGVRDFLNLGLGWEGGGECNILIVNGLAEGHVDITADQAIGVPGAELHTDMNVYAT